MMKQAIAGVAPAETSEVTIMTVWPSIAAFGLGRLLGRGYAIQWPNLYIFRLGNLLALLSIPVALALYFYRLKPSPFGMPVGGVCYKLTNRRVVEVRNEIRGTSRPPFLRFLFAAETRSVALDRFDSIDIIVQPGQEWFHAGDLLFRRGGVEVFRLDGVSRPDAFRRTCISAHMAYVGVKKSRQRELVRA